MAFFTAASKADFQHQLQTALAQHLGDKALPQVTLFAEQFFSLISLDELTQRRLSDLVGCTLSGLAPAGALRPRPARSPRIQPRLREARLAIHPHRGGSAAPDLPFLVDSVRMELNRRGYSIHTLQTNVLSVRRSAKGELKEILPKGSQGKDVSQESLMYLEIDRCAHAGELRALEKAILEVLGEVRVTVADFEPMKAKARELLTWLGKAKLKVPAEELKEVRSYLEWLLDNHFTFLGYEEFSVADEADGGRMVYDEKSFLGLTRLLRAGLSKDDLHIEDYAVAYLREPVLLSFAKAAHPSRVHRPAYLDYVSIRELDGKGRVIRECRFMGLFTSSVYNESVNDIPFIRGKVAEVMRRSGFDTKAHLGKELAQVLEVLPRDDLFQTPVDELFSTALAIVRIQERNKIRVFLRKDPTVASATAWPTCRATCIPPRRA